jgi:hypothetical protein
MRYSRALAAIGLLVTLGCGRLGARDAQGYQQRSSSRGESVVRITTSTGTPRPEGEFQATGNADPDHRVPGRKRGEVVVTFDLLPTRMSFDLPAYPCLVTDNGIRYTNEWIETYDPEVGEASFEPHMDRRSRYSRMWIESQNEARIVVRWRGALCNPAEIIAHTNVPSGSPYGEGDWADEWYLIYPDGVHVRKAKVYTYYAPVSQPFGFEREPPNYIHEFHEMMVWGEPGRLPEDDVATEALTLIKMNGDHTTVSFDPYPIHFHPTEEEIYASFGEFRDANIVVVNTKSEYRPFVIAREEGVSVSPYPPEELPLPHVFQSWPARPDRRWGYNAFALGHVINRSYYQRTDNTLTQIYLSGWTNSAAPETELSTLARSWLQPPALRFLSERPDAAGSYDPAQRAYVMDYQAVADSGAVEFELAASESSPVANPAFLLNNWGTEEAVLEVNGSVIARGADFRFGHYSTLDVEDDREWRDALLVWLRLSSSEPVRIRLWPANSPPNG